MCWRLVFNEGLYGDQFPVLSSTTSFFILTLALIDNNETREIRSKFISRKIIWLRIYCLPERCFRVYVVAFFRAKTVLVNRNQTAPN